MTWLIVLWIVILLLALYLFLFVRYHYRVPEHIEIMQCTVDTFRPSLLVERQPLVCTGFAKTQAWKLLHNSQNTSEKTNQQTSIMQKLSQSMSHFAPWFSQMNPPQWTSNISSIDKRINNDNSFESCNHDVCLIIQMDGESNIHITHPSHVNSQDYTEIRLRLGDGVFIPFQWYYKIQTAPSFTKHRVVTLCWTSYTTHITQSFIHFNK